VVAPECLSSGRMLRILLAVRAVARGKP